MNYKLLIADDDEVLANLLSSHLREKGYSVDSAYAGNQAIDMVKGTRFDLVILDVKMPDVNGFDVLKFIKGNFPSVKVIMLTAYADMINAIKAKRLGADDFIGKPYDLDEIYQTIDKILVS
jgi:DNA-binding response OmpR family regulator